jgi:ABC-type sugar transport system ATPase subunit
LRLNNPENTKLARPLELEESNIAIDASNIEKRYGGTLALKGVGLQVEAGTIHSLVGENGAGKSTFLGVVAGRMKPSGGTVKIFGEPYSFGSPRSAKAHSIGAIYQELTIVPAMSALANVFLGHSLSRAGLVADKQMLVGFKELCRQLDVRIDPRTLAGRLSVADQQMLEIMRGVQSKARILLFDEPTASLAQPERVALFRVMRQLRRQGVTMILVSHNLEEVLDISDTITVFRDGDVVASEPVGNWTKTSLVRAMIGHDVRTVRHGYQGFRATVASRFLLPATSRLKVRYRTSISKCFLGRSSVSVVWSDPADLRCCEVLLALKRGARASSALTVNR